MNFFRHNKKRQRLDATHVARRAETLVASMRSLTIIMAAFGASSALTPCPLYAPQTPRVATFEPLFGTFAEHGAVLCEAPPNATATAGMGALVVKFEVALNGQNFHEVEGGFTYYVQPAVAALGPTRGPAAGGTLVTLELDAKQLEDALHKAFALNAPALVWVPHGDVPSPWDMIMMPKVR